MEHIALPDMICLGFFFMLWPGEHTKSEDNTPFKLEDVKLYQNATPLPIATTPIHELDMATHMSLTFTTQKNGVKREVITHRMTGHNIVCPVRTVVRRVTYLRMRNAPLGTPLCRYYDDSRTPPKAHHVTKNVTTMLRAGIHLVRADGVQCNWTSHQMKSAPGCFALVVPLPSSVPMSTPTSSNSWDVGSLML